MTQSEHIMKQIFLAYLTNYSDGKTRPAAYSLMERHIENNKDYLTEEHVHQLFDNAMTFVAAFEKQFFWNKASFLAREMKKVI